MWLGSMTLLLLLLSSLLFGRRGWGRRGGVRKIGRLRSTLGNGGSDGEFADDLRMSPGMGVRREGLWENLVKPDGLVRKVSIIGE